MIKQLQEWKVTIFVFLLLNSLNALFLYCFAYVLKDKIERFSWQVGLSIFVVSFCYLIFMSLVSFFLYSILNEE